jgi:hypothetical protein
MTKVRSTLLQAAVVGCFVGSLSTGAFGGFKPSAAERSDCMGDAFSLCSYALPNMDRIVTCLASKKSQLSPSCRVHFENR